MMGELSGVQGNHVCVENSMRQNCPVCFEYLFDSVRPTAVLPCGHTIHSDCLREMERNRSVCLHFLIAHCSGRHRCENRSSYLRGSSYLPLVSKVWND